MAFDDTFILQVRPQAGAAPFAAGDILRLKDEVQDVWLLCSDGGTFDTDHYDYAVTLIGGAGNFKPGATVIDYGQSGDGSILLTADSADSPYLSIKTHAGAPQATQTERVRLGNLTGISGASGYGLWTDNGFFTGTIDANAGHIGTLDIDGVLSVAATGEIRQGSGAIGSDFTGLRVWNDGGIGRIGGYNNNVMQWYAGTDGHLYAGGGVVDLGRSGLRIGSTSGAALIGGEILDEAGAGTSMFGLRLFDAAGLPHISLVSRVGNVPFFRLGAEDATSWLQWDESGLVLSGSVTAGSGLIGGWSIDGSRIYKTNAILHSDGYIAFGATPPTAYGSNVGSYFGYTGGLGKLSLFSNSSNYLQWDGTKLLLKGANFTLDASGNLTASNATISGAITASSGSITGALTLGTSGGIYQGTGTFSAPTTGLKLWNDAGVGRIGGYNAGNLQWYAGTDGRLYAGGGQVVMDSTGIVLGTTEDYEGQIRFNGMTDGEIMGVKSGTASRINVLCGDPDSSSATVSVGAYRGEILDLVTVSLDVVADETSSYIITDADRVGIGTLAPGARLDVRGTVIINEDGDDYDTRIEGDTDANLIMVDASTDRVGIGVAAPTVKLDVNGNTKITGDLTVTGTITGGSGTKTHITWLPGSSGLAYLAGNATGRYRQDWGALTNGQNLNNGTMAIPFALPYQHDGSAVTIKKITVKAWTNDAAAFIDRIYLESSDLDNTVTRIVDYTNDLGNGSSGAVSADVFSGSHTMTDYPYTLYFYWASVDAVSDIGIYGVRVEWETS